MRLKPGQQLAARVPTIACKLTSNQYGRGCLGGERGAQSVRLLFQRLEQEPASTPKIDVVRCLRAMIALFVAGDDPESKVPRKRRMTRSATYPASQENGLD